LGRESSARLFRGVIRSFTGAVGGRLLRRRAVVPASAAAAEDDPTTDFRRGILEVDGGAWRGAVAEFIDERRRRGIVLVLLLFLVVGPVVEASMASW